MTRHTLTAGALGAIVGAAITLAALTPWRYQIHRASMGGTTLLTRFDRWTGRALVLYGNTWLEAKPRAQASARGYVLDAEHPDGHAPDAPEARALGMVDFSAITGPDA